MKKAHLSIEINVSDDFECGNCSKCPLRSESYFDNHMATQTIISCKIGFTDFNCPIITEAYAKT